MASDGRSPSAPRPSGGQAPVRAAEVIGAMSIATDLGTGQPLEHALRTAILAVRLGELAGLSPPELVDAYYISLLHSFGCTSDATEQTELFGDDIEPRAKFALVDGGSPEEVGAFLMDVVGQGRPPEVREAMVAHALENALEIARSTFALHCEVAQRFAGWLGFGPGVISNLAYVFERWDGNGFPGAAAGEAIALPARVFHVARDILGLPVGRGPRSSGRGDRAARGRRLRSASGRPRDRPPRRAAGRARRRADLGPGDRRRAPAPAMDDRRGDRRRVPRGRHVHRPQVLLAARARRGRVRARRGGRLAPRSPGGRGENGAARRARARPRPSRGVERNLGDARALRSHRLGACTAPPILHRALVRPRARTGVNRGAGGCPSRAARRRRLPPQDACARAGPSGADPRCRRLLPGDARAAPAPARARR